MFFQVVFLALLALLPMVNPPTTATLLLEADDAATFDSGRFKGTLDNTLVFGKLREALGL